MNQTLKVSSVNSRHVKRDSLAYRVACQSRKPLGSRMMVALRESQSATGEELDALLPSVLDRAFKGEL
jgi:hypothetical protein